MGKRGWVELSEETGPLQEPDPDLGPQLSSTQGNLQKLPRPPRSLSIYFPGSRSSGETPKRANGWDMFGWMKWIGS